MPRQLPHGAATQRRALVAVVVAVAALSVIGADGYTQTVHSRVTRAALATRPADMDAARSDGMVTAVLWNDTPCLPDVVGRICTKDLGNALHYAKKWVSYMGDLAHRLVFHRNTAAAWYRVFSTEQKPSKFSGLGKWHSMSEPGRVEEGAAGLVYYTCESKESAVGLFIGAAVEWYRMAVAAAAVAEGDWYLGHALHVVQDSFSSSHVHRHHDTGRIGEIQSYMEQNPMAHLRADQSKSPLGDRWEAEAVRHSAALLGMYLADRAGTGLGAAAVERYLRENVYVLGSGGQSSAASPVGGTVADYSRWPGHGFTPVFSPSAQQCLDLKKKLPIGMGAIAHVARAEVLI